MYSVQIFLSYKSTYVSIDGILFCLSLFEGRIFELLKSGILDMIMLDSSEYLDPIIGLPSITKLTLPSLTSNTLPGKRSPSVTIYQMIYAINIITAP